MNIIRSGYAVNCILLSAYQEVCRAWMGPGILRKTSRLFIFSFALCFLMVLDAYPVVPQHSGDTIYFSGYSWVIKESSGKQTGPGTNYFSGSRDNVWVDSHGRMHMKITFRNEKWYCPEVRMLEHLGYGEYVFHVDKFPQPLDKDVVVGIFMYDHLDTTNYNKEIDIEFSKWGKTNALNTQFVVQPHEDKAFRFDTDFNRPTVHSMQIRKRKIVFRSSYEKGLNKDSINTTIAESKFKPDKAYKSGGETVSMNMWLYKASEPDNLKEFEVIISRVEFLPDNPGPLKSMMPKL